MDGKNPSKIEYAQRFAKRNEDDHSKVRKVSMGPIAHSNMVSHTPGPKKMAVCGSNVTDIFLTLCTRAGES